MSDKLKIYDVLHDIQVKLKCPKNRDGYKYKSRNAEDILERVKELMPVGYSVMINDEIVEVAGRLFVQSTASLVGENQHCACSAFAELLNSKGSMSLPQETGATSSYARKYALGGLFAIDGSDEIQEDHPAYKMITDAPDPDSDEMHRMKIESMLYATTSQDELRKVAAALKKEYRDPSASKYIVETATRINEERTKDAV